MPSFFKKISIVWVCVALLALSIEAHAASSWTLWADSSNGLPVVPAGAFIADPRLVVDTAHNAIYMSGISTWKPGLGYPGTDNVCRVWKGDLTTHTFTLLPQTGMGQFEVLDMIINKAGELVISGGWGTQGTTAGTGGDFFYFDATQQRWFAASYIGTKPNYLVHNMSMAPNGTIWGAGRWHDVYKSTDNGRTFTDINPQNTIPAIMWPMPDGKSIDIGSTYGIFYDPNTQRIYAGTETGGVIFSADDGAHWDSLDPHYHGNNGTSTINEGYLGNVWGFGLSKTNELIINGYANVGTGSPPGGTFGATGQALYHYNATTQTDGVCTGFPAYLLYNQAYYDHIRTTADGHNFFEIERYPNLDVPGHGGIYISADGVSWTPFNTGIAFPNYLATRPAGHHNTNSPGSLAVSGNDVYTATADGKIYWYNTGGAAIAPSITSQPANQSVTAGQTASFNVTASGTAPLTYQWRKNGVAISGATASTCTTPSTVLADNGATFSVVVSNSAGTATSQPATLTVIAIAPSITTQPANQSVTAGQSASFSVTASGTAPLTYQWSKNGTAISGATAASYTTPISVMGDNGATFTVAVSNSAGTATSQPATLTVNAVAPGITNQPANQSVTSGQTASFSVTASGTAPLTYQWSKNGVAISGATASSYTTPITVMADNGATFTVAVSNTAGTATSQPATLTVNAVAPGITAQPANQSVNAGQTASFSVTASGTAPLTYQWSKNGTAISGATAATYTTPPTAIGDNGAAFSVTVTNAAGSANSNAAILSVNAPPVIASQPTATPNPATAGQTVTFSVSASDPNNDALTYTWTFGDGTSGSGATSSHAYAVAGSYSVNVKVTDTTNLSVISNSIVVTVNAPVGAAPTITKLTPNSGLNGPWGTYVAISGTNFATSGTVSVTFGGVAARYVSVSSSALMHVYTPAHAPGVVDVKVTNPDTQSGILSGGYTFKAPPGSAPVTGSAAPAAGSSADLLPMTVTHAKATVRVKGHRDSFSISGVLPGLPATFDPQGATLLIDFGGASATFTLNSKGKGSSASGTFVLALKMTRKAGVKKSQFAGGDTFFKAQIRNGSWAQTWADSGLDLAQTTQPISFPALVVLNDQPFLTIVTAAYKGKPSVGGSFTK